MHDDTDTDPRPPRPEAERPASGHSPAYVVTSEGVRIDRPQSERHVLDCIVGTQQEIGEVVALYR